MSSDREAVEAMVARVVRAWSRSSRCPGCECGRRSRSAHGRQASTLDPTLLQLVVEMNLFGTVYSYNAVAPIMKQ
jgi:3-oxoacyl-[acyl-carrier protein] reductase